MHGQLHFPQQTATVFVACHLKDLLDSVTLQLLAINRNGKAG